ALSLLLTISGGGVTQPSSPVLFWLLGANSAAGVTQPASPVLFWLLGASLAIDVVFVGLVIHRIVRVARAQSLAAPGARLHLRFVALFSLAALTPAIVVALFMGVALTQGLENWFNPRVQTVVDRGGALGQYMIDSMNSSLSD